MRFLPVFVGICFVANSAIAQPSTIDCGTQTGYKAYLILDQSLRSDAFRDALKKVANPDRIALNFVKGDFSGVGTNAERHPLVFVYDKPGAPRKIDSPAEFVKFMNSDNGCGRQ